MTLVLPKQDRVEIGCQYRFYFKSSERILIGSSFLDASLPTDGFLGLEVASDYSNIDISHQKQYNSNQGEHTMIRRGL